ncbi:hypothetical protein QCE63_17190 [Caballeronia sp. LZ065]|uniref:hypothetical protein n=1 Tax=Caballeronia sp. LZ065 TaxID=3038571 RepID=UPI00286085FF|nr:hypothetical protein [Caballeronia sp. LZ065]MDR5781159.1 hypothetical protein [Caballeronia sp. LZ065]
MKSLCPETIGQLADRWTVLINEISRFGVGQYPNALYIDVHALVRQTEKIIDPNPSEQDLLRTVRQIVENGDLKLGLFKLHEVIAGRLET